MTVRKDPVTVRKPHVVRYPGRLMISGSDGSLIYIKCHTALINSQLIVRKGVVAFRKGLVTVRESYVVVRQCQVRVRNGHLDVFL